MALPTFDLESEILREHSKRQCDNIATWVGNNPKRFDQLLQLVLKGMPVVQQRGSWPLSNVAIAHPELLTKSLEPLIANLQTTGLHNGIKRHTMRILEDMAIPENVEGDVMNICFNFLQSPTEAIAVKAICLTVLGKLARIYPEIIPEIKLLIEEDPHQTPALKSRATKLLKTFSKSKRSLLKNTNG
ncbi:MAG: hypothetical protein Q7T76_06510 [Ferruginibacter sp.]|nr:hypothetical protein [Ferruginibacter sp.]